MCEIAEKEQEIYSQYQKIIAPFIAELEARDGDYPTELLNEIRSIFTHMARFKLQNEQSEIISAERHVKRAILDCYKYLCISIAEKVALFRSEYKDVDLHLADNGSFLPLLNKLENQAKEEFVKAKKAEIIKEEGEEILYKLYEEAYCCHCKLDEFLDNSWEAILFASNQSKKELRLNYFFGLVGVIGVIVGIVGLFV